MGSWGEGIFDNDAALDFVDAVRQRLGTGGDRTLVSSLLARAAESTFGLDAQQLFAAVELTVAAASGEPSASGLVFDWRATPEECQAALSALQRAARESDLAYHWADLGTYADHLAPVQPLAIALGGEPLSLAPPTPPPAPAVTAPPMPWQCTSCRLQYEAGPEGQPFEALPETWTCDACGAPRAAYVQVEPRRSRRTDRTSSHRDD
jgi:rubredoxin